MGLVPRALTPRAARSFWLLVGVRAAYWVGTALTLLWSGFDETRAGTYEPGRYYAYEARSELLFNTFARWDANWYIDVAYDGYESEQEAAFFPLYPLLVAGVNVVLRSHVVAGVLVALVAAGVAAVLLERIAREVLRETAARDAVIYLALYPIAFVFTSVYAEGLFLALACGAFLAALRERPWLAGLLGALAVATRPVGLALLPALALLLWSRERPVRLAPLLLLPAAIGAYAWYLERTLGDALAFVHAQDAFWMRRTGALGPIGGLWDAAREAWHGAAQVVLHLPRNGVVNWNDQLGMRNAFSFALLVAALALTVVAWRRLGAAYGVFSVAYLAIVLSSPAEGYPLVSFPRFVLGDFPLFLALASLTERRPGARQVLLSSFAAIGAVAAIAFAREAWVA